VKAYVTSLLSRDVVWSEEEREQLLHGADDALDRAASWSPIPPDPGTCSTDLGEELVDAERLGEVVVGSGVDPDTGPSLPN